MSAEHPSTILIVDDSTENLYVLSELLRPLYRVLAARSGPAALAIARRDPQPDLILLDVMMPGMDGYDTLEELRAEPLTSTIPVIFLTALSNADEEERGLSLGAADYITKPIKSNTVLARVRTQLQAQQARVLMQDQNERLETEVRRRMAENDLTQRASIQALAHLAEMRDTDTGNHLLRTQAYVRRLALGLRAMPHRAALLTPNYIDLLVRSAPLHDIGKVGIPDHILLKPGKLTPAEWTIMKTHAKLGSDAIEKAEQDIDTPLPFLALAKEIAHWHHEKWDGSGYPDGLAGEAIPLSARLMAVADVFDALVSARVYKAAMSFDEARRIIEDGSGNHFDPALVDVFLADYAYFVNVAERGAEGLDLLSVRDEDEAAP